MTATNRANLLSWWGTCTLAAHPLCPPWSFMILRLLLFSLGVATIALATRRSQQQCSWVLLASSGPLLCSGASLPQENHSMPWDVPLCCTSGQIRSSFSPRLTAESSYTCFKTHQGIILHSGVWWSILLNCSNDPWYTSSLGQKITLQNQS